MFYSCAPRAPATDHGATAPVVRHGRYSLTVDIHGHFTSRRVDDLVRSLRKAEHGPAPAAAGPQHAPHQAGHGGGLQARLQGVDHRLAEMDAMGIDVQVVSPGPVQYNYSFEPEVGREASRLLNDDLMEITARHPDRLVPMGTVPLQDTRLALEELERCVKTLGMRGIEIATNVNGVELSHPRLEPFFAKVEELGILLFIHPQGFTEGKRLAEYHFSNSIGNPLDTTIAIGHLIFDGVLDRHPGLKICVAHGGGYIGSYVGRMDQTWRGREELRRNISKLPSEYMKQLHFDTVLYDPIEIENLVRRWGADRVLLGTDWPYPIAEQDPLGMLERCEHLDHAQCEQVAGLNAARLLGIDVPSRAKRRKG